MVAFQKIQNLVFHKNPSKNMAHAFDPSLDIVIEGWGGKQGWHFPTWKVRWFVLQKKPCPPDTDEVADARDYFRNSSDTFERAHNFNEQNDKKYLVLSYFTDETKTELKEVFHFDENTTSTHDQPRITTPKFSQGVVQAVHLFCKGSRGSSKLIFIPFWGFVEPHFKLMTQPWLSCFEFGFPKCYDRDDNHYYEDFLTVNEDVHGRTSKDLEKKFAQFKAMFDDDVVFKTYKEEPMAALKLFVPIKLFGKNAQEDDTRADQQKAAELNERHTKYQMRFNKCAKDLVAEKEIAGGRDKWLALVAQARAKSVTFETWMKIKDDPSNVVNQALLMRTPTAFVQNGSPHVVRGITAEELAQCILSNAQRIRLIDTRAIGPYAACNITGCVHMFWGNWERKEYPLQCAEHVFPRHYALPINAHYPQLQQVVFYGANADDQAGVEKAARLFTANIGTLNAFYRVLPVEILVLVGGFDGFARQYTGNNKLVNVKKK